MFQDSVPAGSYNDPFLSSVCACVLHIGRYRYYIDIKYKDRYRYIDIYIYTCMYITCIYTVYIYIYASFDSHWGWDLIASCFSFPYLGSKTVAQRGFLEYGHLKRCWWKYDWYDHPTIWVITTYYNMVQNVMLTCHRQFMIRKTGCSA